MAKGKALGSASGMAAHAPERAKKINSAAAETHSGGSRRTPPAGPKGKESAVGRETPEMKGAFHTHGNAGTKAPAVANPVRAAVAELHRQHPSEKITKPTRSREDKFAHKPIGKGV